MTRPLNILQFWDKNPLVPSWIDRSLPIPRMIVDSIVTIVGILLAGTIIFLFLFYVFESDLIAISSLMLASAYFPGGWWGRWMTAAMKFQDAKQKERESHVK